MFPVKPECLGHPVYAPMEIIPPSSPVSQSCEAKISMLSTALISVDVSTHHPYLSCMLNGFLVPLCSLPEPPLVQQCSLPWH